MRRAVEMQERQPDGGARVVRQPVPGGEMQAAHRIDECLEQLRGARAEIRARAEQHGDVLGLVGAGICRRRGDDVHLRVRMHQPELRPRGIIQNEAKPWSVKRRTTGRRLMRRMARGAASSSATAAPAARCSRSPAGERAAAMAALQQRGAELLFEIAHGVADRRLGEAELTGGRGQAAEAADRLEDAHPAKVEKALQP